MWELVKAERTKVNGKIILYTTYVKVENGLAKFKYATTPLN